MSGVTEANPPAANQGIATPVTTNVEVYMEVALDLSGNLDVLSAAVPTLYQIVNCAETISASSLYGSEVSGILEFWEDSDAPNSIEGRISDTSRNADASYNAFEDFSGALYTDLETIFSTSTTANNLDAGAAAPFNNTTTYNGLNEYTKFQSLGRMMLAWAAHYAFGHVAATAAIDNDLEIIAHFDTTLQVPRMFMNSLAGLGAEPASRICRSVIAQDPDRARDRDNNELAPGQHMALEFKSGDVLYLRINMRKWTVTNTFDAGYIAPTGDNPTYGAPQNLATNAQITALEDRLIAFNDQGIQSDQAEAARGTFFHFKITVA